MTPELVVHWALAVCFVAAAIVAVGLAGFVCARLAQMVKEKS